jgi:phage/plasmid-like protein (TIGR03299 family)
MAHELDVSTGEYALAYIGETPWHGLGEKLSEGESIEAWLKAARLEWELQRLPVQYLVDGKLRTMEGRFVLARSDTDAALSVVSGDYYIVQPKQVIEFYRDLVDRFGYVLETAGALDSGRKIWGLARTGRTAPVDKGGKDNLAAYVLLATSCDKSLATTAAFTSVRVVCQNTLFFAMEDIKGKERRWIKVSHDSPFDAKKVQDALGLLDESWTTFMSKVRAMSQRPMKAEEASSFFSAVLGQNHPEQLKGKAAQEHDSLKALFNSAPGQDLISSNETVWGAVNAVTYYVDHVRSKSAGDRLNSSWFGSGFTLKEKAWARASELV